MRLSVSSSHRSASLKSAREKAAQGAITPVQLKAVEDEEIPKIVAMQEAMGLKLATDGEYRRAWWHFDFFGMLDGVEIHVEQAFRRRGKRSGELNRARH